MDAVEKHWNNVMGAHWKRARAHGLSQREGQEIEGILKRQLIDFREQVALAGEIARSSKQVTKLENPLFFHFRQAFVNGHLNELQQEISYRFIVSTRKGQEGSSRNTLPFQKAIADLTHPLEWFPATRAMQREVHLHIGPTNSGKTYHALKRLEQAKSGVFAGPLRLLAHEVYTRFNAKGVKCALITGEEQRIPDNMEHNMKSCTVEMIPLNDPVDVCVVDEIQMIGDKERGWAWTNAFLGVQAKELHLCGEVRTEQIVRSFCEAMGEKLIVHRYERLGLLETETKNVDANNLRNLKKGDAVIMFSRLGLHGMKKDIEKATGKKCAVVYGSLPPETRAAQAALFNDPDNDYDYLAASNAVGMGLNLSIKRIIFSETRKRSQHGYGQLETSEIKQIAGRAGRYRSAHSAIQTANIDHSNTATATAPTLTSSAATGYVNAFHRDDLAIVGKAMNTEVEQIKTAGIGPPAHVIQAFAALFPKDTSFSYIILRLKELVKLHSSFHYCHNLEGLEMLDLIQPYELTIADRMAFMAAPTSLNLDGFAPVMVDLVSALSMRDGRDLMDFGSFDFEMIDRDVHDHPEGCKGYLRQAEILHKALTVYLWLSYRFSGVYRSQALCFHVKALLEEKIDQCLAEINYTPSRKQMAKRRSRRLEVFDQMLDELQLGEGEEEKETSEETSEELNTSSSEVDEEFDNDLDEDVADDSPADGNIPEPPVTNPPPQFIPEEPLAREQTQDSVRS